MMAMPLIPVVVRIFGRHIFRRSREAQDQLSDMSAYSLENFSGIRVVQAYAQEENQIRGFNAISSDYRRKTMWLATLWGIFWPLMQVHAGVAATIVLWLAGRQVLAGTMTLGEFVAFNGYLAMLTWPLMAIGYTANQYQRGTASLTLSFTDPANANDTYTATINWGDSAASVVGVTSGQVLTHVYADGSNAYRSEEHTSELQSQR